jgi:hypothetical protein
MLLLSVQDLPGSLSSADIAKGARSSFTMRVILVPESVPCLLSFAVLDLKAISADRHWAIFPCSAVSGKGLVEGVEWVVSDIASRIFMLE